MGYFLFTSTTSIYRAELPADEITQLSQQLSQSLHFTIPIYIDLPNSLAKFIPTAESAINGQLYTSYPQLENIWSFKFVRGMGDANDDYVISYKVTMGTDAHSVYISPFSKEIKLELSPRNLQQDTLLELVSNVLLNDVFGDELAEFNQLLSNKKESNVILPYSSNYNVIFSLFTESGKTLSWDIDESVSLFTPIFEKLSHFTNFTVSSQIQYYSNLADDLFVEKDDSFVISQSDLSTFINFGDWNLFTHDINPTINFLVFFPKANYEDIPSIIENSVSNSFLVPQWGGVSILNKPMAHDTENVITKEDLLPIMETFASHLFQLLGMPQKPKSPSIRIDSLSRLTVYKNLKQALENLNSLVKLTESLSEISIPELTRQYVLDSLDYIEESMYAVEDQDFKLSMTLSSKALQNSNDAFFEKEMVQQAYFPSEHKMAVFLPLIGPVSTVCLIGLLKLIRDKRSKKQEQAKKDD